MFFFFPDQQKSKFALWKQFKQTHFLFSVHVEIELL